MKLIYINGHGHSGSTILDFLLGNHPQITSGGEFHALWKPPDKRKCSCGMSIITCDYWKSIKAAYLDALNITEEGFAIHPVDFVVQRKMRKMPNLLDFILVYGTPKIFNTLSRMSGFFEKYKQFSEDCWSLYHVICQMEGSSYVVDSSKGSQRLKLLYMTHPEDIRAIHLVRDGRAILDSALKRGKKDIRGISKKWSSVNQHALLSQKGIPESNRLFIRYEDLCNDTSNIMKNIFTFLGVDSIDDYSIGGREHHLVPGNEILFKLNNYAKLEIRLNETWKENLPTEILSQFDTIAGKLNRRFGYN